MSEEKADLGQLQIIIDGNTGNFSVNVTSQNIKDAIPPEELTSLIGGSLSWFRLVREIVEKRLAESDNKIIVAHALPKGVRVLPN